MPVTPPPTTWLRYLLGGCGRTLRRLLLWSLWLVLGVVLAFQVRIYLAHEVDLPGPLLRYLEKKALAQGASVHIGAAHFDPQGHIVLEEVSVTAKSAPAPLLRAARLELTVNPLLATAGIIDVRQARVSHASVTLPGLLSPTGTEFVLIDRIEALVSRGVQGWDLKGFRGELGTLLVTARGPLPWNPPARSPSAPATPADPLASLNSILRTAAKQVLKLDGLEAPQLDVALLPLAEGKGVAHLLLRAARFRSPAPLQIGRWGAQPVTWQNFRAAVLLRQWTAWPDRVDLRADNIAWGQEAEVGGLEGSLSLRPDSNDPLSEAEIVLRELQVRNERLPALTLRLRSHGGLWTAEALGRLWQEPVSLRWEGRARTTDGIAVLDTRISPAWLAGLSPHVGRDLGALLQPAGPAPLSVTARLGPQGALLSARGRLDSGPVGVGGVPLLGAAADFSWQGREVLFDRILLVQGASVVRGSYWMDTSNLDYRFLLQGPFRPEGIAPWFRDWWPRFWSRFKFEKSPFGDISIHGRWGHPLDTRLFLGVDARSASIREAFFDRVRAELFIRPHFIASPHLLAEQADATAEGAFTRRVSLAVEKDNLETITFDLRTSFPLQKFVDLFGDEARPLVSPYAFARPPQLIGRGKLNGPAHPAGVSRDVALQVKAAGDLTYLDFPLRDFSASIEVHDNAISVKGVQTHFARGKVIGDITVDGPENRRLITFDGRLTGANLGEAIEILDQFGTKRAGKEAGKAGGGRFQRELASGLASVELKAEGLFGDPYSFRGKGKANVFGSKLGEINLLGQLSSALRGVPLLDFTSFSLNQGATDFDLNGSEIYFPRLRITGPSAEVIARGSYFLRSKRIGLDVTVYPFAERQNFFASTVGVVLSPLSAALELRLEGNLEKPNWYFTHGPTSLLKYLAPTPKTDTPDLR